MNSSNAQIALPNAKDYDDDVVLAGDYAMEVLVNAMLDRGAKKQRLVAKAFGGGNVVSAIRMAIGARNAAFAEEWLDREGIRLLASDFGGPWSRKVICVLQTGEAFCRRAPVRPRGKLCAWMPASKSSAQPRTRFHIVMAGTINFALQQTVDLCQ